MSHLDGAGQDVAVMRQARGEGRPIVENIPARWGQKVPRKRTSEPWRCEMVVYQNVNDIRINPYISKTVCNNKMRSTDGRCVEYKKRVRQEILTLASPPSASAAS